MRLPSVGSVVDEELSQRALEARGLLEERPRPPPLGRPAEVLRPVSTAS